MNDFRPRSRFSSFVIGIGHIIIIKRQIFEVEKAMEERFIKELRNEKGVIMRKLFRLKHVSVNNKSSEA